MFYAFCVLYATCHQILPKFEYRISAISFEIVVCIVNCSFMNILQFSQIARCTLLLLLNWKFGSQNDTCYFFGMNKQPWIYLNIFRSFSKKKLPTKCYQCQYFLNIFLFESQLNLLYYRQFEQSLNIQKAIARNCAKIAMGIFTLIPNITNNRAL